MVSSIRPDRSCTMGNQGVMDLAWQDLFKLRNQGWQIKFDRIPQDGEIDTVLSMNEPVPHADHFAPGNLGVFLLPFLAYPCRSLTDIFHQLDQG